MEKKKIFKLADIIIIMIIILIIITIFLLSLNKYKININSAKVEILYQNEILITTDFNNEGNYKIIGDEEEVRLYKDDVLIKTISNSNKNVFHNEIVLEKDHIHMSDASCKNKDCMRTTIDKNHNLPIIS